jgi:conjugal transfer pilus assembly protein TraK
MKILKMVFMGLFLVSASKAFGADLIDLTGVGPYIANISNKSINRIALPLPAKEFIVQKDVPIDVKLMGNNAFVSITRADFTGTIDLYLTFENHDPIGLTLVPTPGSGQTVILRDPGVSKEKAVKWEKAVPYEKTIKDLVKKMAMDEIPSGYSIEEGNSTDLSPWKEASIQMQRTFKGANLTGEIYSVLNTSPDLFTFDEDELAKDLLADREVKAISIQNRKLESGKQTLVYVVRGNMKEGEKDGRK